MSNSCSCGNVPVPCDPEVPSLLNQLVEINEEFRASVNFIETQLFGDERCSNGGVDAIADSGYIGVLKRLVRDSRDVLSTIRKISDAL